MYSKPHTGASRTDAGAHASGQVAHLDVVGSPDSIQPDSLMMYLNGVLPPDVKVQQLQLAPPGFDSHFSSVGKQYLFKLNCGVPHPMQVCGRRFEQARLPGAEPAACYLPWP